MMKENDLAEFSMEQDGLKIHIKRSPEGAQPTVTVSAPALGTAPLASAAALATAPIPNAPAEDVKYITSPMVGTFYRAPAPDAPPYAEIGKAVEEDTVVCIIEAMKVMNEIKAEMKGVITEVLADNSKPVEFGQKLFVVKPR
jgi:acetyl-CoA carboxylase biotin carboxyl carrier protein